MKKFFCKKCKEKKYMSRKDLRKHLKEEHLIKTDMRCLTDGKDKRHLQSWWGEEEWE